MDFKENQGFSYGSLQALVWAAEALVLERVRPYQNTLPHGGVMDFLRFRIVPWGCCRSVDFFKENQGFGSGGMPGAISRVA